MDPALLKEFCDKFTREVNRLRLEAGTSLQAKKVEVARIERDLDKIMKLIMASDDVASSKRVMRQMNELEARKDVSGAAATHCGLDGGYDASL